MTGYAFEPIQLRNTFFDGKKEQKKNFEKIRFKLLEVHFYLVEGVPPIPTLD